MKKIILSYITLDENYNDTWEFTGLFYLAGALEKANYTPYVFHGDYREITKEIKRISPDVLGFSCDFENQSFLKIFIQKVKKEFALPVVVGGPQAMGLSCAFLKESGADYLLRGECEETLPKLLDWIFDKEGEWKNIPGLLFREGECFHENSGFGIIEEINSLPNPAYHASLHQRDYGRIIFTGRGCPYSCTFCASNVGKGKVRLQSIVKVLETIKKRLEACPTLHYMIIMDDTFCINRKRMLEFCEGMLEIRRKYDVVWYCECHVEVMEKWPEMLPKMIEAGLVRLQIGIESGDERTLAMYGKQITPKRVLKYVEWAVSCGIPQIATNFIVGGPIEEEGKTEKFIKSLLAKAPGIIDINTGFLRAYPGTAISQNPDFFDVIIKDVDGHTILDDCPGVVPMGMTEYEVIQQRQKLNQIIREEMYQLIVEKALPLSTVMQQFKLGYKYNVHSRWFLELNRHERVREYYKTVYYGEGEPFYDNMPLNGTFPQRTFEFYRNVITQNDRTTLDQQVLAPLEYDILFYASGKISINAMAHRLWPKYKRAYKSLDKLIEQIKKFLHQADKRYWTTTFVFE